MSVRTITLWVVRAVSVAICMSIAGGASSWADDTAIPKPLLPWAGWVKEQHPEWECAQASTNPACVFPSRLTITEVAGGARFELKGEALSETQVSLPGRDGLYPSGIAVETTCSTAPLLVTLNGQQLQGRVCPGPFKVTGSFIWDRPPSELPVPADVGIVTGVDSRGGRIDYLRSATGVRKATDAVPQADTVGVAVARKLEDGSPMRLSTTLKLRVSGGARALTVSSLVPKGADTVRIESPVPYNYSNGGELSLQLTPGEHEITILSLVGLPRTGIEVPKPVGNIDWPTSEIWAWVPRPEFRSVRLSGASPVSKVGYELPEGFGKLALYQLAPGDTLQLEEIRRGEQLQQEDSLRVDRDLWIDLDGNGFTVEDVLSGSLFRSTRINVNPPMVLTRVSADEPLPLSKAPGSGKTGVEIRDRNVNLRAVSRIEGDERVLPAFGWDFTATFVAATLHLPPSWLLLGVTEMKTVDGSWISKWTLLDLFFCVLLSLAVMKVISRTSGVLVFISLVINHGEFLAPQMLLLYIVVLLVWERILENRESSMARAIRGLFAISLGAWLLQCLAFVKLQLTQALYPQLQAGTRYRTLIQEALVLLDGSLIVWPTVLLGLLIGWWAINYIRRYKNVGSLVLRLGLVAIVGWFSLLALGGLLVVGTGEFFNERRYTAYESAPMEVSRNAYQYKLNQEMNLDAGSLAAQRPGGGLGGSGEGAKMKGEPNQTRQMNIAAGAPRPDWRWRSYRMESGGPVASDAEIRVFVLPPWATRLLSVIRAVVLLLLAVLVVRVSPWANGLLKFARSSAVAGVVILGLGVGNASAEPNNVSLLSSMEKFVETTQCRDDRAQLDDMLALLRSGRFIPDLEKALEGKRCKSGCTLIQEGAWTLDGDRFSLALVISSAGRSVAILPGPLNVLPVASVQVDGAETTRVRRNGDGFLEVALERGVSRVLVEGVLGNETSLTVRVPQRILVSHVSQTGWQVDGIEASGATSDTVQLTRRVSEARKLSSTELSSWITLERRIQFGDSVRVTTTVRRIGSEAVETVRVPVLPDERVISGDVLASDGSAELRFPAGESELQFVGLLPHRDRFSLRAVTLPRVSETWIVTCDLTLDCKGGGLAVEATTIDGMPGFLWEPFPEETATVDVTRLAGVGGEVQSVDKGTHRLVWGMNQLRGELSLNVVATEQSPFWVEIPKDTSLARISVDGVQGDGLVNGSRVSFLLSPGTHALEVVYQRPFQPKLAQAAELLKLSAPVHNLTTVVEPSEDRWIVWLDQSLWGPCVVIWGKVVCLMLLAFALVKFGVFPGGFGTAALLAVGLATLPLWLVWIPFVWLVSLQLLRARGVWGDSDMSRRAQVALFICGGLLSALLFYRAISIGLVFQPPMMVAGNQSTASMLRWFTDHAGTSLSTPVVYSLSLTWWRGVSMLWASWAAVALLRWVRDAIVAVKAASRRAE